MNPADFELALRFSVFLAVFAALAAWEHLAPSRALSLPRTQRWQANLGLAILSTLLVRVVLPGSSIAIAAIAASEG